MEHWKILSVDHWKMGEFCIENRSSIESMEARKGYKEHAPNVWHRAVNTQCSVIVKYNAVH